MILIADSESSRNFASIGSSMTCFRLFGGFRVEESHFGQTQDFPSKQAHSGVSRPHHRKIQAKKYLP